MSTPATHSHDPHHGEAHAGAHGHGATIGAMVTIYFALMVLLAATVIAAFAGEKFHFDRLNIFIAIGIALVKAIMVVWVFMHVKYGTTLIKVFAFSAFVFIGIMLTLTFSDYLSRDQIPRSETYINEPHHRYPQTDLAHPTSLDEAGNPVADHAGEEHAKPE